jgi:hypothetical protein
MELIARVGSRVALGDSGGRVLLDERKRLNDCVRNQLFLKDLLILQRSHHYGFEIQHTSAATAPAPIMRIAAWRSQLNSDGKNTKTRSSALSVNRSRSVSLPGKDAGRIALPRLADRRAILEHTGPMFLIIGFSGRSFERYRGITAEPELGSAGHS